MQPGKIFEPGNLNRVISQKSRKPGKRFSQVLISKNLKPGISEPGKFSNLRNSRVSFFVISENSRVKKKSMANGETFRELLISEVNF